LSGPAPAARWWSVTAYDEEFFLFENGARRYSVNGDTEPPDSQGQIVFDVGPEIVTGDPPDLPTQGTGTLLLTLRLYNPAPSLQRDPGSLVPPLIDVVGNCP
jgi:hypothetical protein